MSYNLPCDWRSGFVMDPTKKPRLGYLVWFQGLNMVDFLKQDIKTSTQYKTPTNYKGVTIDPTTGQLTSTGVIDSFSWAGGVSDPLCISAYISQENATILKNQMMGTLKTTTIKKLAWWICNFSLENKVWYEEAWPASALAVTGQLNAPGGKDVRLNLATDPTKIAQNIDVNVYNVYFEVVPAANAIYTLGFATSPKAFYKLKWGLQVASDPTSALA